MTVVYIDILLALNLFIDYILLCATARVLHLPTTRGRVILGAVVGALSSLIILLPPMGTAISVLLKLASAVTMVPIAFHVRTFRTFCKITLVLFVISALFAGVCNGLCLLSATPAAFVQSGVVYADIPPTLLLVWVVAAYGVLCVYDRVTRKRMAKNAAFHVELTDGDFSVTLRALFDSGHSLRESFSGAPVIVADRAALKEFARQTETPFIRSTAVAIRYIPFSSIGGDGVLPAFRPPQVILRTRDRQTDISGVWIAVCDRVGRGEYDALIGPSIAEQIQDGIPRAVHTTHL